MKTQFNIPLLTILLIMAVANSSVVAWSAPHVGEVDNSGWPEGMRKLANAEERISGYFVNAADYFFFSGDQAILEKLLLDYSKISELEAHQIVINPGGGPSYNGRICDWHLYGCPSSWKNNDPKEKTYTMEVHVWVDGKMNLDELNIPKGLVVEKKKTAEPQGGVDQPAATAADLSVREKTLLQIVISQNFWMRLQAVKTNQEEHPFHIALSDAKDKEQQLLSLFKESKRDTPRKLLAAQSLAYLGNKTGMPDLEGATFKSKGMPWYMTSSGFEISESALCLLFLGFDFPDTFKFSEIVNPMYPEMDKLLGKLPTTEPTHIPNSARGIRTW
jgi:hypothetical protein